MKNELKIAIDDALAAKIGNPNLKVKGGKTTDYAKLSAKRKSLMKNLAKRNVDLETYMKAIGALSVKYDKRITSEDIVPVEQIANQTETMEIVESSRQSIGGDSLRQLRENLHFTSTFASTQVPPSFTAPKYFTLNTSTNITTKDIT